MEPLTAVLMIGPRGAGGLERMVAAARMAAAADLVDHLKLLPGLGRMIVAVPQTEAALLAFAHDSSLEWEVSPPDQPFHFGQRLTDIIQKYQLTRVLYLSAGSMPLMPAEALATALAPVAEGEGRMAVTNNVHSADWAAFTQAHTLAGVAHWLDRDNMLAWRLRESAGYHVLSLPAAGATRLDIDTPFDLQVLALHPQTPPHLRATLDELAAGLNLPPVRQAIEVLRTPGRRVALIGRVPAAAWQRLEALRLWTRVFSEERGMVASRRQAAGEVFSLVADYVDRVGEAQFISRLAGLSDLVLFDTRVYLAHHHCWPPAEERFASDLGRPAEIQNDCLRRLTQAAAAAPVPILLGGHTVVSGGLYALAEIAGQ